MNYKVIDVLIGEDVFFGSEIECLEYKETQGGYGFIVLKNIQTENDFQKQFFCENCGSEHQKNFTKIQESKYKEDYICNECEEQITIIKKNK